MFVIMAAELVRAEMLERWRNGSRLARLADAGWLVLAGVTCGQRKKPVLTCADCLAPFESGCSICGARWTKPCDAGLHS